MLFAETAEIQVAARVLEGGAAGGGGFGRQMLQFFHVSRGAEEKHTAVPQVITRRDEALGGRGIWLLDETRYDTHSGSVSVAHVISGLVRNSGLACIFGLVRAGSTTQRRARWI